MRKLLKSEFPPDALAGETILQVSILDTTAYRIAGVVKVSHLFQASNELEQTYNNEFFNSLCFCLQNKIYNKYTGLSHHFNTIGEEFELNLVSGSASLDYANNFTVYDSREREVESESIIMRDRFCRKEALLP